MKTEFAQIDNLCCASHQPLSCPGESQHWFALGVTVRHEKVVSQLLQNKGFETFLPLYLRRHHYTRRIRQFELPLFPGYLFCRSDPSVRLPILTTPGVLRMIGAGRVPIPIEDHEITSLQKAVEAGVSMVPHPYWHSGQRGRITAGPLAGLEGIIVSAKDSMRLVLSVGLLQRSVLLEIDSDCVTRMESVQRACA
jgi:transcription antitermination factor NusG